MSRASERGTLDNDTRTLLLEGDVDVIEAKLNGIQKGIWALVLVVSTGVVSYIFDLIRSVN